MSGITGPQGADAAAAQELQSALQDLLARHHVLTLACRDAQGCWAAPVFYAAAGLDLFYLSTPDARHSRCLDVDRRLAGAVHGEASDWQRIVGVQLAGEVQALEGTEAAQARGVYERRFPFVAAGAPGLARALQQSTLYRLRIDEAVLVDNTRGLGARRRWQRGAR